MIRCTYTLLPASSAVVATTTTIPTIIPSSSLPLSAASIRLCSTPRRYISATSINAATVASSSTTSSSSSSSSPGLDLYVWGGNPGGAVASVRQTFESQFTSLKSTFSGLFGGAKTKSSSSTSSAPAVTKTTTRSPWHLPSLTPVSLPSPDGTGFRDISFGHNHIAFITGKGDLYTLGEGSSGQLGHGTRVEWQDAPLKVQGLPDDLKEVKCGQHHTLVLSNAGEVFSFGRSSKGNVLGRTDADVLRPGRITKFSDNTRTPFIKSISTGSLHNLFLAASGQLYSCGNGDHGRLGLESSKSEATPVLLRTLAHIPIVHISTGSSFNAVLSAEGDIYTWGRNEKGQLGIPAGVMLDQYANSPTPSLVQFPAKDGTISSSTIRVRQRTVACGYKHTLSISEGKDNNIYLWGQGDFLLPHLVDKGPLQKMHFIAIAGGDSFSCAVTNEGHLATWGRGATGCLGLGENVSRINTPTLVKTFGSAPEKAGLKKESEYKLWRGAVKALKPGHNHMAVLTSKQLSK